MASVIADQADRLDKNSIWCKANSPFEFAGHVKHTSCCSRESRERQLLQAGLTYIIAGKVDRLDKNTRECEASLPLFCEGRSQKHTCCCGREA